MDNTLTTTAADFGQSLHWNDCVITTVGSSGTTTRYVLRSSTCAQNVPVEQFEPPAPRRRRGMPHRPDARPWQPKLVLRELVASWACSLRAFAGR